MCDAPVTTGSVALSAWNRVNFRVRHEFCFLQNRSTKNKHILLSEHLKNCKTPTVSPKSSFSRICTDTPLSQPRLTALSPTGRACLDDHRNNHFLFNKCCCCFCCCCYSHHRQIKGDSHGCSVAFQPTKLACVCIRILLSMLSVDDLFVSTYPRTA